MNLILYQLLKSKEEITLKKLCQEYIKLYFGILSTVVMSGIIVTLCFIAIAVPFIFIVACSVNLISKYFAVSETMEIYLAGVFMLFWATIGLSLFCRIGTWWINKKEQNS